VCFLGRLSDSLQIIGRHFSAFAIGNQLIGQLLAFLQVAQSGSLDGADVNESIGAAIIRLDEAKTLGGIEPFYGSSSNV